MVVALLLENAGLPVPGETVLLFASFLAFSEHALHLRYIILMGTFAAAIGDNVGYAIGHHGGRPLLDRYQRLFRIAPVTIHRGEQLFQRSGAQAIFFARFIFGMRVIAGPLAGILRMPWKRFVIFNLLGAVTWVSVIATVGFLFGSQWQRLLQVMRNVNIGIVVAVVALLLFVWWRQRRKELR